MHSRSTLRIVAAVTGPDWQDVLRRYWAKVAVRGNRDCWNWTAGTGAGGYGVFKLERGVTVQAHRMSLLIKNGLPNRVLETAHSCDNVLCCNPAHLRWATRAENEADKGGNRRRGPVTDQASLYTSESGG